MNDIDEIRFHTLDYTRELRSPFAQVVIEQCQRIPFMDLTVLADLCDMTRDEFDKTLVGFGGSKFDDDKLFCISKALGLDFTKLSVVQDESVRSSSMIDGSLLDVMYTISKLRKENADIKAALAEFTVSTKDVRKDNKKLKSEIRDLKHQSREYRKLVDEKNRQIKQIITGNYKLTEEIAYWKSSFYRMQSSVEEAEKSLALIDKSRSEMRIILHGVEFQVTKDLLDILQFLANRKCQQEDYIVCVRCLKDLHTIIPIKYHIEGVVFGSYVMHIDEILKPSLSVLELYDIAKYFGVTVQNLLSNYDDFLFDITRDKEV